MFCTGCGLKIPDNIKFCPNVVKGFWGNGKALRKLHKLCV